MSKKNQSIKKHIWDRKTAQMGERKILGEMVI
jgi:hypothetical protein